MLSKIKKFLLNLKICYNKVLSKIINKKIHGKNITVAYGVDINNVNCDEFVSISHHAQLSNVKIGKRTSIGRYAKIRSTIIGSYTSISWDVTIGAVNHDIELITTSSIFSRKSYGIIDKDINVEDETTYIGNDVWIGCNVVILSGVKIGDGAIIGAGATVTKDVAPYEIVGGVPAKHIRYRFDNEIIEVLKKIKWWNWSDEKILKHRTLFENKLSIENINRIMEDEDEIL